jgi:hypothetical protein
LEKEHLDFSNMATRLAKLLDWVDEQTAKMAAKRQTVLEASQEQQAAKLHFSAKLAEHETLELQQLDEIAVQLDAATSRTALARRSAKVESKAKAATMEKLQAEVDKTDKVKADREAKVQAARDAAAKATDEAAKMAKELEESETAAAKAKQELRDAEAAPGGGDDGTALPADEEVGDDRALAAVDAFAAQMAQDNDDDKGTDDESEDNMEEEITTLDAWREHFCQWAFHAGHGEPAPQGLVTFYCGVGKGADEMASKLGKTVDDIRDKLWQERRGEASDAEAIRLVEQAGEYQKAYDMRLAQGFYAAAKYQELREELLGKLATSLEELDKQRQDLLDKGEFTAKTAFLKSKNKRTQEARRKNGGKTSERVATAKGIIRKTIDKTAPKAVTSVAEALAKP